MGSQGKAEIDRQRHSRHGRAGRGAENCIGDLLHSDQFCRQSAHTTVVMPSHGKFVGASSNPLTEREKSPASDLA
jgi:hypothetical protein